MTQTIAYTEDTPAAITDIVVSDPDADTFTATVTLAAGDSSLGSLSATSGHGESHTAATGVWTVSGTLADVNAALAAMLLNPALNSFANVSASVSISDGVAPALTGTLTFNGTAVNVVPTATNLTQTIAYTEDTPAAITDIVISDPDADTFTATVTLAAGDSQPGQCNRRLRPWRISIPLRPACGR